jgi:tetratricopeptide (TPR) repeat protein
VHPHVATILNNLGLIAADREDYASAESLFRQSLAISHKTLGESHPTIASTLINLGRPLLEQGKYDEAASVLDEGIRMARASLGDEPPQPCRCSATRSASVYGSSRRTTGASESRRAFSDRR